MSDIKKVKIAAWNNLNSTSINRLKIVLFEILYVLIQTFIMGLVAVYVSYYLIPISVRSASYIFVPYYIRDLICIIFFCLIHGIFKYGKKMFYFEEDGKIRRLFDGFSKDFLEIITIGFIRSLLIFIGLVLLIVPGVWFGIRTLYVYNIKKESPGASIIECFKLSFGETKGNHLFKLYLSFIGWKILSIVSLGLVGVIHYKPYLEFALLEVRREDQVKTVLDIYREDYEEEKVNANSI